MGLKVSATSTMTPPGRPYYTVTMMVSVMVGHAKQVPDL